MNKIILKLPQKIILKYLLLYLNKVKYRSINYITKIDLINRNNYFSFFIVPILDNIVLIFSLLSNKKKVVPKCFSLWQYLIIWKTFDILVNYKCELINSYNLAICYARLRDEFWIQNLFSILAFPNTSKYITSCSPKLCVKNKTLKNTIRMSLINFSWRKNLRSSDFFSVVSRAANRIELTITCTLEFSSSNMDKVIFKHLPYFWLYKTIL